MVTTRSSNLNEELPTNTAELAAWFAEGVRSEITALENDSKSQRYELLSGRPIESKRTDYVIFQFTIADGTRIPDDASGQLKTATDEYGATVIGQQGNVLQLSIQGTSIPREGIPRAILSIDDTALLRRLADVLENVQAKGDTLTPQALLAFHPENGNVGFGELANTPQLVRVTGPVRRVLEQACGSQITYIWGPPGTGKTFAIAHLVTALIESGNRVLVTSHTHAAVDQILYESIKPGDPQGPIATHSAVGNGEVIRIGPTADPKIPDSVRLDRVVDIRGRSVSEQIAALEKEIAPLVEARTHAVHIIAEWQRLAELEERRQELSEQIIADNAGAQRASQSVTDGESLLHLRREEAKQAQLAWFRKKAKTERALKGLREAEESLRMKELERDGLIEKLGRSRAILLDLNSVVAEQVVLCHELPALTAAETDLTTLVETLKPQEQKLAELQQLLSNIEQEVIDGAQVIFCTLTKVYTGKELEGQIFDAVIIDEISMALPPLVFLAAGRAESQVILVGDFLQLPPIVRSDMPVSNLRLGTDSFHLSGLVSEMKPLGHPVLASLEIQRRMVPRIANVARHLAYTRAGLTLIDHEETKRREPPIQSFLPDNPLIVVDTTELHCWSGKQPGSLSRFNFYSAVVSVELAAMAATFFERPTDGAPKPIGIITPYAAQRRLLAKLVNSLELDDWVVAGTVHTFQGSQAETIIFDSVLDEPYWSARLCSPRDSSSVRRDLNVAVTRAKNRFIFVGSSAWLNGHANPSSGLGELWSYLVDHSDFCQASDLVSNDVIHQLAEQSLFSLGWTIPESKEGHMLERHDENSFWERFAGDLNQAKQSIFGLAPFFGEYRWPRVQPLLATALSRGVEVTLVIPPVSDLRNASYVESAAKNLRGLGAVVVTATGLHGKDVIIDERIIYTGSLNWSSHRGTSEWINRIDSPQFGKLCLDLLQARYIRQAAIHEDGTPRLCPRCRYPTKIVNQKRQHGAWDYQAMKVGCANPNCNDYLRNLDERPPFKIKPVCSSDGRTKLRRVRRGRGEVWQCPKHPKLCRTERVVPGDPT